ncbi:pyridoxal-dependent decarboxylase [Streptomyces sp. NBC_00038]|uniref:pyridoxal-dependent decarboxylase n=1 Tax=Streptomyces sp. NBC_00038 TaxID=2903615 RepID=UPI002256BBF5|nr:pyridoxal-dependent decarboxylase [Streptomyces sp. NBC_00038]MCX5555397.1 pyridoxal-dependent decarboxylase [Streptomyces sp. NBC_00038]
MTTAPTRINSSPAYAERLEAWRTRLVESRHLSNRFRDRYSIVLAQMEALASTESVAAAREAAADDPHRAAELLAGITVLPSASRASAPLLFDGDADIVKLLRDLLAEWPHLDDFMAAQQPLAQTAVPIHPSRRARILRVDERASCDLVALVWSAGSVEERQRNAALIAGILPERSGAGELRLAVQSEYALVRTEASADPWVFSPNLGETLEDVLRSRRLDSRSRRRILTALRRLRAAMLEAGLIWQGFAPRNMFLRDGEIVLIDFEEVVDSSASPARAAECLLWHRIFFADSLTAAESAELFAVDSDGAPTIPDDHPLPADSFERALLAVDTVTWRQRRELLGQSLRLEGQHRRPERRRDGGVLYGHELGHFWGDFLPVAHEVRLFSHLSPIEDPDTLVACLEAFEAAMEADICRAIRASYTGTGDGSAMRTEGLIDALDAAGVTALAEARQNTRSWYEQLAADPARLMDELLFQLGTNVGGVTQPLLDTYLVGSSDARKGHEEDLVETVRVGLDFLHGAEPDQPFLRYAEPTALRQSIAQPLPREGLGFDHVLAEVNDVVARYSIGQGHSRYLAFPDSGNALAALAGNLLSPLLNQNLIAVDRSAPSATFVEAQVIEWLRELVGYPTAPLTELRGVKDVSGLWTTGGHLSNHIAMLAALGHTFPDARKHGLRGLDTQPAVVMAGPIAHYSHSDAAFHLGLGWDAILSTGAKQGYTTDPEAVDRLLSDPPSGRTPFMVVGVAGNCRTTGLDDLEALGEVCRKHGVWFHVDACHGGSLIFNDRLRQQHLRGIEQADSVSLDPHKGLFTPYPSSYVLFREREVLTQFSRHTTTVMADDCWDLGLITPFLGSRGFQSLPTWMLLRHVGTRVLGAMVEARQALVRYLERRLDETGLFVRLNDVDFYRLAFVFCPPGVRSALTGLDAAGRQRAAKVVSAYTSRVNTGLYQAGEVCFDEHSLADLADRVGAGAGTGYTIMAACPGNPLLTRADLDVAVERLVAEAQPLVEQMLAEIRGEAVHQQHAPRLSGPAGWNDGE